MCSFRRCRGLVAHLLEQTDVQNIDLTDLASFSRSCLSRCYREVADTRGVALPDPDAREIDYGIPYKEWQALPPEVGAYYRAG
jgi:hypothetical protein